MLRAFVLSALSGLALCAGCTLIGNNTLDEKPSELGTGGSDLGKVCLLPEECSSRLCSEGTCSACNTDKDCQPTPDSYCDGGRCVEQLAQALACSQSNQCQSGHCVNEVCCESVCGDECMACAQELTGESDGRCAQVMTGLNPDESCGEGFCSDSGKCCGVALAPSGRDCPGTCNGGCADGVCIVNLDDSALVNSGMTCPAGFACEINCFGTNSCTNADLYCPNEGESCKVQCECTGNNINCCQGMRLYCGNGPCLLECGEAANACNNTEIVCGTNQCEATCSGDTMPQVNCNSSCGCTSC